MRIYIAGPYTGGNVAINVHKAIDAGTALIEKGHYPYIPHLTHFWHLVAPQDYEVWTELDMVWLSQCEAVLRLPGLSPGADKECAWALAHGMTVYLGIEVVPDGT